MFVLIALLINAIAYSAALLGLYMLYRKSSDKRIFLTAVAIVVIGYVAVYVPSIQQRIGFRSWANDHPPLVVHQNIGASDIEGALLPHLTCTALCMGLLLNGHFTFVETGTAAIGTLGGSTSGIDQPYARWSVVRDPDVCWSDGVAQDALAVTKTEIVVRGLLAQGICFRYVPVAAPTAVIRFTQKNSERHSPGGERTLFSQGFYEARRVTAERETILALGHYRWESTLAFPLLVSMDFYYVPTGFRLVRTALQHGVAGLTGFVEALLKIGNLGFGSNADFQPSDSQLETIRRAISAENPHVRWSAALAVCRLKRRNPELYGHWIEPLLADKDRWVRAAAQQVKKQRPGQNLCNSSMRSLDGGYLKGPFFSSSATVN